MKPEMDDERRTNVKDRRAIFEKTGGGGVYKIGQRKGGYDSCNMIGSKF
jgi:hypothetical protein